MSNIDQAKNQIPLSRRFSALCAQLNNGQWSDQYDLEAGAIVQQVREKLEDADPHAIAVSIENPAEKYLPVLTAIAQHTVKGRALFNELGLGDGTIKRYVLGTSQPSLFVSRKLVTSLLAVVDEEIADFARCAIHRTRYAGYAPSNSLF